MDAQTLMEILYFARHIITNEEWDRFVHQIIEINHRENDGYPMHEYYNIRKKVELYKEIKNIIREYEKNVINQTRNVARS